MKNLYLLFHVIQPDKQIISHGFYPNWLIMLGHQEITDMAWDLRTLRNMQMLLKSKTNNWLLSFFVFPNIDSI